MDQQAGRPNALLKSKSSNTRVKPRVDEKKSKSSGEFKSLLVKKRGVYVEKRSSSPGSCPSQVESPKIKAPPRSRPGAKQFLDSVLSILSKNTTSTQFPIRTPKMSKNNQPITRATDDDDLDLWLLEQNTAVKKSKHKKGEPSPKPKRDGLSRDSHNTNVKSKVKLGDHAPEGERAENKIDLGEIKVPKSVIDNNKNNLEKENLDPVTMVTAAAKDEKLYSLFVDLLETVYNAKTDKDAPGKKSTKTVKTNVQKDDLVKEKEPRRDVSPTNKLFINKRFAKVIPQPFDSKWREQELEENVEECTQEFEVDGKLCQSNVFEEVVNEERYSPKSEALAKEVYKELPERVITVKAEHELRNVETSTTSKVTDKSVSETGEVIKVENMIDAQNSIARSVMEGLNMEKKTDTTPTSGPEKEKKLYSLFVNLLESVYPDLQSPELFDEVSNQSSKLHLEGNAAQKLNDVPKQTNEDYKPPCAHCKSRDEWHPRDQINHRDHYDVRWFNVDNESEEPERRVRKKVKRNAKKHESPERRAPKNPRPLKKKNKKQELLAIIRQQLTKHDENSKEPATFYDALRIMARNRRKEYNDAEFIRCAQDVGVDSDNDSAIGFKKRKPSRTTRARPMRYPKANRRQHAAPASARFKSSHSEYKPPNYVAKTAFPDSDDSYHSLAVFGYDYCWKPNSADSLCSSGEIVDYEVTYNWQSTVGSQCYKN